jgi:hypothetical protein
MSKHILIAAIFVLVGLHTSSAAAKPNPILTQAAQTLEPRVTSVECTPYLLGYAATAPVDGAIWMNSYLCNPLKLLYGGYLDRPGRAGAGLITLEHEVLHITAPTFSEARVECVAFQTVDNDLRLWKTPFWMRGLILEDAYQDHYNLIYSQKVYRNDTKCRPDGAWDTTPGDGNWP